MQSFEQLPDFFPEWPQWKDWEELITLARSEAEKAARNGEVPVGALLLNPEGQILARAANAPISLNDPTAHAEMLCIRQAGTVLQNYRLEGCILVATLEPCLMCLGAIIHARIAGIVFGAFDPKAGAITSRLPGPEIEFLNHRFWWIGGVDAESCSAQLSGFFEERRRLKKAVKAQAVLSNPDQ